LPLGGKEKVERKMKIAIVELVTVRQVQVGIPDSVETTLIDGKLYVRKPGPDRSDPPQLVPLLTALQQGLLVQLEDIPAAPKGVRQQKKAG
jgi:hypothetical protein